jgi:hypothetical protein
MTTRAKKFDCVEFKHELHRIAYKKSGAKSIGEYVDYVNKAALKSSWHKVAAKN